MSRAVLVVVLLSAGCPGAKEPPDVLQCGLTPAASMMPCPSERALAIHLRDRWSLPAAATIATTCTPGRFGGAGWVVRATVEREARISVATFVLQPSCGALTDATLRDVPPGDDTHEVVDLDGDGTDEIIVRRSAVEPGGTSTSIEVLRVGGGRLVPRGKVRITYSGTDAELPAAGAITCDGAVRFPERPDRGYYVEIDAIRSAESALCLATGRHRFELAGAGLQRL
jgi:hypothetical protein